MTRYVFEEIRRPAFKSVPCSACGRKVTRQRTFMNTINPWNVNPDGTERTRSEIWEHLGDLADAWKAEPETHPKCAAATPPKADPTPVIS